MKLVPKIGDVISLRASPDRHVVVNIQSLDLDIYLFFYILSLQKLNPDGSFNPQNPIITIDLIEPFVYFPPLTEETALQMTEDELINYQNQADEEAKENASQKSDEEYYFDEVFFHGHMSRVFV